MGQHAGPLAWVAALAAAMTSLGCVGEAAVEFNGTVVTGSAGAYTFDYRRNPRGLPPVEGARVRLFHTYSDKDDCRDEPWWREAEAKHAPFVARTSADGWFDVHAFFGGFLFVNSYITICADKDGYEPFVYKIVESESRDPGNGREHMNIVLQPVPVTPRR